MEILIFLIPGAILLLLVIFVIATYNGLVRKRNMVRNAFSTIDVMLKKRHELIPNLVETVKAFAAHEKDTFEKVIALRNQARSEGITDSDRFAAEGKLSAGIGRLLAISEDYPELRSGDQFLNLQRNLTEIEEQISASRRSYNAAVLGINNAVETFPTNLIAQKMGFARHDFFEAIDDERESISLDL